MNRHFSFVSVHRCGFDVGRRRLFEVGLEPNLGVWPSWSDLYTQCSLPSQSMIMIGNYSKLFLSLSLSSASPIEASRQLCKSSLFPNGKQSEIDICAYLSKSHSKLSCQKMKLLQTLPHSFTMHHPPHPHSSSARESSVASTAHNFPQKSENRCVICLLNTTGEEWKLGMR